MNSKHHRPIGILILLLGLIASHVALAARPVKVTSADPAEAPQHTIQIVTIYGSGFDTTPEAVTEINFLLPCDEEPCIETGKVNTMGWEVHSSKKIVATIEIEELAVKEFRDIEVKMTGRRGGKGTTLFKVVAKGDTQPNDCRFEFEAEFRDALDDGVQSDGRGSYVAFGGKGMRLDTNGSQKLERRNDTRWLWIDFEARGTCDSTSALNPAGATGFCNETKGVDMRIEHQVQEPAGLCSIDPSEDMFQTVKINFEGGPVSTPLLEEFEPHGNGGSTEPASFTLNYGCQGARIEPLVSLAHVNDRVLITRMDEHTWIFEGQSPCLTSQLGNIMVASGGDPILLDMPFALCIVDVNVTANLPSDHCEDYFNELLQQ